MRWNSCYKGKVDFDYKAFDNINFPEIDYETNDLNLSEYQQRTLGHIQGQLENKIVQTFDNYELTERPGLWQNVTKENNEFHNDYVYGDKFNSNILVYLDKGTEENDNYIEVKETNSAPHRIYPEVGEYMWLNQAPGFFHRANNGKGIRRVIHFAYYIPEIKKWNT